MVIDRGAFHNCTSLAKVKVPSTLTMIGECAFLDCRSLTEIALPRGMKSIANRAFSGCSTLGKIRFGGTLQEWTELILGRKLGVSTVVQCADGCATTM